MPLHLFLPLLLQLQAEGLSNTAADIGVRRVQLLDFAPGAYGVGVESALVKGFRRGGQMGYLRQPPALFDAPAEAVRDSPQPLVARPFLDRQSPEFQGLRPLAPEIGKIPLSRV